MHLSSLLSKIERLPNLEFKRLIPPFLPYGISSVRKLISTLGNQVKITAGKSEYIFSYTPDFKVLINNVILANQKKIVEKE